MASKLIIAGAAAALLAGAGGLYVMQTRKGVADQAGVKHSAPAPKLAYVDVKEITLRLSDSSAEHYIKITPVLGVREAKSDEMQDKLPVVRDRIVTIVTARSSAELATPQGAAKLKQDLLAALRQDFPDGVMDIYFSGYLVE